MPEHTPTEQRNCCAVLGNVAMQRLICVERSRKTSQTRHSVDTNVLLTFLPRALPPPPAASFSPVSLSPPATDKSHYIFPSLSLSFCKRQEIHITFSILYLSSPATGNRCISPPTHLLQRARSTHYISPWLCLSSCNSQQHTLHLPLSLSLPLR